MRKSQGDERCPQGKNEEREQKKVVRIEAAKTTNTTVVGF